MVDEEIVMKRLIGVFIFLAFCGAGSAAAALESGLGETSYADARISLSIPPTLKMAGETVKIVANKNRLDLTASICLFSNLETGFRVLDNKSLNVVPIKSAKSCRSGRIYDIKPAISGRYLDLTLEPI
jgi:hypothetical protein